MSRFMIAASLVAALVTSATSAFARTQFAAPPPETTQMSEPADYAPIAQRRMPILDRATVRAKLALARTANLARFRAYQQSGVFPSNTFDARKLNVWMDAEGHLCAAATIINASGQSALVQQVAEQTNFIRLADVKQGPLMDWILTSGLTQDEIAAIQEPFMPVMGEDPGVDPGLRAAETMRLLKKYKTVTAMIVKNQKTSLDRATERLMKHPELAWRLLEG